MDLQIKSYDDIAENYSKVVDLKPFHSMYERPNILKHIPADLSGLTALDLGCGTGWYAEELAKRNCDLIAVDNCQQLVELTQKRLNNQRKIHTA